MQNYPWLSNLNPQQQDAVTHGDGPILVVAGAGSGKTRTLAYRVAYLIAQGVKPDRILLLTFTRRAAKEMLDRASKVAQNGSSVVKQVWGGTFHGIANRLLRIYAKSAGLSPEFTIMDQSDAEDLINVIRHKKDFSKTKKRFPKKSTCLAIYSRRMNSNEDLLSILKKYFPWCEQWENELKQLFKEYVEYKQRQNILDYDDLLLYWYYLLDDTAVADSIEKRFDYILVDEYQDTNKLQADILQRMRRTNKNIMVVGDDAQSIYSFRYASVQNILDFPKQLENTTVITIEQNYRSVGPILTTTNRVIAQSSNRFSKELYSTRTEGQKPQLITCSDENHESETVIEKILEHYEQGIPLYKQAVLFRAGSHSNALELELIRRNIPFHKYGGLRFLEAAHIKDLVCILRIAENPKDEMAWFRILQLFDGIGPASASHLYNHLSENNYTIASLQTAKVPSNGKAQMRKFTALLLDLQSGTAEKPSLLIERISRFYLPLLNKNYENPEPRANDIEHLGQLAERFPTITQFLAELVLDPPVSTGDYAGKPTKDEDHLVLSTIHSAKGCEWDVVFVIHAADGCLPSEMATGSDRDIEEELRLVYVAMTRARDFLYVLWPMRFYKSARSMSDFHTYAQCSRFFTQEVCATMDDIVLVTEEEQDGEETVGSKNDIGAKLRGVWD